MSFRFLKKILFRFANQLRHWWWKKKIDGNYFNKSFASELYTRVSNSSFSPTKIPN
jgi:hypothetical protein